MRLSRTQFGDEPDSLPTGPAAAAVACPELEAVIRHALAVWATARDRGGLTAHGVADVAEALEAVGEVVALFAAEGRDAANAHDLTNARAAARRASQAARQYTAGESDPPAAHTHAPSHAPQQNAPPSPWPRAADQGPTSPHSPQQAPSSANGSAAGPPARVLVVVVDDAAHRDTLVRLLRLCGHEAFAAADGQAALDALRDGPPPHLILLDMMMPGLAGTDVLRAMRADPALPAVPVVVYSAAHEPAAERAALALGAREYVVKARAGLDEIRAAIARHARAA